MKQIETKGFAFSNTGFICHLIGLNGSALCGASSFSREDVVLGVLPSRILKDRRLCQNCKSKLFVKGGKKRKKRNAKKTDSFYQSWEWKKARYETLKEFGPVCMCCNSTQRIIVDHIKPRKKFPRLELDRDNLQVLCNDCNMGKSNDDYTDFRPREVGVRKL